MQKGNDISQYQGGVNFDELKASGSNFVIIKASNGCPDPGQSVAQYVDPMFSHYRSEAQRVGLEVGLYHFAYTQYNEPEPEAVQFFNTIGLPRENEIYCLDFEEPTSKDKVEWVRKWCVKLSELLNGYTPLLYINKSLANTGDWKPVIDLGVGLWLASWDFDSGAPMDANTPWPFLAFRQYSDKETVPGVSGGIDGDVFYGDEAAFNRYGYHAPKPVIVPEPVPTYTPPTPEPAPAPISNPIPVPPIIVTTEPATTVTEPAVTQPATPVVVSQPIDIGPRGVATSEFYMPFLIALAGMLLPYINAQLNLSLTQEQTANAITTAVTGLGTIVTAYAYVKGRLELKKAAVTASSVPTVLK